jgi:hypothetical protein
MGVPAGQHVLMGVRGGEGDELDVVSAGASGARDLGCRYSSASTRASGPSTTGDRLQISSFSSCK